jgi:hypothetical protein
LDKVSNFFNGTLIFPDLKKTNNSNQSFVAGGRNPCLREEWKGKAKGEERGDRSSNDGN